jgi:hypothetical protein
MRVGVCMLAIALFAAAGCGKPDRVRVYPVHGQILYDGKPAAGVQVFLFPTAAPGVPDIPMNPRGETGPDGYFTLTTYSEGDGAAEGGYQLVLYWPEATDEREEDGKDRLLGWYTMAHSKISVQIKPTTNELPPIKLPVVKFPPAQSGEGIPGRN